jgi:hypothetical protein
MSIEPNILKLFVQDLVNLNIILQSIVKYFDSLSEIKFIYIQIYKKQLIK